MTYNCLFHFIHYFPVPSQSSNLNSFMHWIDTKFIKHLLPAKEHSRDWDNSCKHRIPPSSLHASGKNDDFERYYNLFVNTISACWQNVSKDASAMGSHCHNLMRFINCTTEGNTSYTVWANLDIRYLTPSVLSPML